MCIRDRTFLLWHSTGLAVLVTMSVLCALLDYFKPISKLQPYKDTFSFNDYADAIGVALFNGSITHWPFSLSLFYYWKQTSGPTSEFTWTSAVLQLAGCGIIVDVWFYWTHRLLHYGILYKLIHKKHHRFTAPCSLAAVYAHPVEFGIGNYTGVALGPALCGVHPWVGAAWWAIATFGTCLTHSGYGFTNAVYHHDMHHEFFNCNFGVTYALDYLCGTDDTALGYEAKKEVKMKAHNKAH
eukprot:TRINITY_DN13241_c0_g1_i2.p1 TRINITY_DN13241_c0_g1~~TRINITY_DN13241_c0_g1_i2.p1  ORF type:complete len:240 (-),score=47.66 TRINITY_DN13241_c0_g1_i2:199-918(-)